MRCIGILIATILSFPSCRRDEGEDDLKWSCARTQSNGQALATPECAAELARSQSAVLKH